MCSILSLDSLLCCFLISANDVQDVEPGEPGEVLVRGPLVTQGYYDNPTAAKESFHGGWFCTGDIAVDRGGKFHIVDRKKVRFWKPG